MVVLERRQAARLLIFLAIAAALTWYVLSKRDEFYDAARGTPADPPAGATSAQALPAGAIPGAVPTSAGTLIREPAFPSSDPLADGRLSRARARSQELETLRGLAENPSVGEPARAEAARKLVELLELARRETDVEALLRAKNFADALVFLHRDHADVIVRTQADFGRDQAAAVIDLVVRATGLRADRVAVVARP